MRIVEVTESSVTKNELGFWRISMVRNYHRFTILLIAAGFVWFASIPSPAQLPDHLDKANQNAISVSLITLIANPDRYEGKVVRVIGFVQLEFEGNAIYLHEEDFRRAITDNALWMDVPQGFRGYESGSYAIVEGTFTTKSHGHMGLFSGEIKNVTRLEPWLGR
jgi:hypothetical protein